MTVFLAGLWVLGALALWPRAWVLDDFSDRERFDGDTLFCIVVWPVSALVLVGALLAGLVGGLLPIAPAPVMRPRRHRSHGRLVTWAS